MSSGNLKIDTSWTLFLDRDGVINKRIIGGYVRTWEQFEFIPGVLDGLKILEGIFPKVFIVSNQQGIGKGIMTDQQVMAIHDLMLKAIKIAGGRIDKVYFCPSLKEENSIYRKPNIGMALSARKDFPGINFKKSVMAGDSVSDMIFGKKLRMLTVFLSTDKTEIKKSDNIIDLVYPDLISFAKDMEFRICNPKSTP